MAVAAAAALNVGLLAASAAPASAATDVFLVFTPPVEGE
jgi:hypothetical protein